MRKAMGLLVAELFGLLVSSPVLAEGGYDANAGGYEPTLPPKQANPNQDFLDDLDKRMKKLDQPKPKPKSKPPENLTKAEDWKVCQKACQELRSKQNGGKWLIEANRRNLMNAEEFQSIRSKRFFIGMSECGMYASLGLPEDANRSVGSWGVHVQ